MTELAVIVPTHRRPVELARCLAALAAQTRPPDEVVVAVSPKDGEAQAVVEAAPLRCALVEADEPGVLAAMVAGVRATTAEVVCFTDDDAIPYPDWIQRLEATLSQSALIGGVGGRDVVVDRVTGEEEDVGKTGRIGRLTWYGRHTGEHHLGSGWARDVAFLKSVNAAYRREALGIPEGLRGGGAEVHHELAVGRYARVRGYRLVYDPRIAVEHRPAARHGADQRGAPEPDAVADAAYNLVVAIGGWRGLVRVLYATAVGDRGCPGVLRALAAVFTGDRATARRLAPSLRGTLQGGATVLRGHAVSYETFA